MRAAQAAIAYEHPRLPVVATVRENDLADRLTNAIAASGKVIEGRPTQVIEPPKADEAPPLPDHSHAHRPYFAKRF